MIHAVVFDQATGRIKRVITASDSQASVVQGESSDGVLVIDGEGAAPDPGQHCVDLTTRTVKRL